MANLRNYDRAFDKDNVGLGLGGNPQDMTLQVGPLNDVKDKNEVTINPPQPMQPKKLNKTDFITMMNQ